MRKIIVAVAVALSFAVPSAVAHAEGEVTARALVPCIDCWR